MPAEDPEVSLPLLSSEDCPRKAFEQIYYEHAAALFRYGARFSAPQPLVEDCVQELFADLWERRETLAGIRSLRFYLLGALRRKILRQVYTTREQLLGSEELFTLVDQRTASVPSEDAPRFSAEASEQLTRGLQQLTARQQEVLYLRFYNQLSFPEVAEIMSIQTRAVYKLCHRAIATLNDYLSDTLSTAYFLLLLTLFH